MRTGEHVQTLKKIIAEAAGLCLRHQISVRRSNDSDIHLHRWIVADMPDALFSLT